MPCSRNFCTFHMVIKAVGDEDIMMMGVLDLAFLALFGSAVWEEG